MKNSFLLIKLALPVISEKVNLIKSYLLLILHSFTKLDNPLEPPFPLISKICLLQALLMLLYSVIDRLLIKTIGYFSRHPIQLTLV